MGTKYLSCFLLFIFSATNLIGQGFYDINTINTIELTFDQSNWDYLLDSLAAEGEENRLLGAAVINGISYDSVGVRYKGNSSYRADQIKNPLNIKLDYVIEDQEHEGYDKLKLANVYKDPSFIREALSYEIARDYMPASLANFIKVTINGTYIGLYTSVQDVDKSFLRNHFYSGDNSFFKGELAGGDVPSLVTTWGYFGEDSASYTDYYELKSDYGWANLINFLDMLNNNTENVEEVLNVDRHLWMLAFDNLTVNLDAPINFAHNYYLYEDDAGKFNPIIWDLNENFGGFSMLLEGPPLSPTGMQQLNPYLNSTSNDYPIISKILSNATYKKMYVAHMKTIMDDYFINGYYRTRALEIQSIIDSEVQGDPNKFYTYSNFISNIDNSVGGGGPPGPGNQQVIGVAELMEARTTYLNSLADFQAAQPVISNIELTPSNPAPNSDVSITAEVAETQSAYLLYRFSQSDAFEKLEMLDDGNNNDGAAGDGVFGVTISTGTNGFQYYIYAENENAASFLPTRAAYEFYTLTVSGDLVVNEFMASNESTVSDADGEFDDWIELYNNTDADIPLNGYFLSDDGSDLTQWAFPDTVIAANSYLIVWADNDDGQDGLHTNFKLSASGESIYLVDSDTLIVNEVAFGEQTTDISTGRYPNGTGSFIEMSPTFSTENQDGLTGIENDTQTELPSDFNLAQNFPNPFNPSTQITVSIPVSGIYTLRVYNILGQEVATLLNDQVSAGKHTFVFDASNLTSGIYFYSFSGNNFNQTKKMMLMK
jgi:CotH protein/lamin tail-like protein/type IX secretion system substrate protein